MQFYQQKCENLLGTYRKTSWICSKRLKSSFFFQVFACAITSGSWFDSKKKLQTEFDLAW